MIKKIIPAFLVFALLVLGVIQPTMAVGEHYPYADTYTDINDDTTNFGTDPFIAITISNLTTCVKTNWLWYKFHIPNTTSTLVDATLYLKIMGLDTNNLPMELVASSDTSWVEDELTWANQPAVGSTVFATSPSVNPGGIAQFSSAALGAYLNANKGSDVTLVVRGNCLASPGIAPQRAIPTKENPTDGPGAWLIMFGPTPVEMFGLKAETATVPVALLGLAGLVAVTGLYVTTRRRK